MNAEQGERVACQEMRRIRRGRPLHAGVTLRGGTKKKKRERRIGGVKECRIKRERWNEKRMLHECVSRARVCVCVSVRTSAHTHECGKHVCNIRIHA